MFSDFPPQYQDWTVIDPKDLFEAPIIKRESNPKAHISRHLNLEAHGCSHLVLWLDCDREGENICFEVIKCTGFDGGEGMKIIHRAKFSSVTENDIWKAMDKLVQPNINEALAVDARQEIDLKVGVAFTRFQTNYFHGKYANLDSRIISYGPCQTPTLGFCVQRYLCINTFKAEKYWSVQPWIVYEGHELRLEWERCKVYDLDVTVMFEKLVRQDGILEVVDVSEKSECKPRPSGLNTVNLLKVASSAYGYGPQMAMQIAERLYIQGYISYPRTESTAYPSSFDFKIALGMQASNQVWGTYVQMLLSSGYVPPKLGKDAGDHPPITPMRSAMEDKLGTDAWRLYEYICRHFIASVSPDCQFIRTKAEFSVAGESFYVVGKRVTLKGFTSVLPWLAVEEKGIPFFSKGMRIKAEKIDLYEGHTAPPDYLTESELISLMERNGIGTDASISVHINNICERNFVQVHPGRKLVPTPLGISLIRGYGLIDPDLCLSNIRSFIEQQITLVAKGQADHLQVVHHVLQQFELKYLYFVKQVEKMDALLEAQFSPIADSGRMLSKCGKCMHYMKYIASQPSRLYCMSCEEFYNLPQKGTIKLYKELCCPLDNFELVICCMPGHEGKSFPLCPYCYNNPPFEGIAAKTGKGVGMPCTQCLHPTCQHSVVAQGVCACPECDGMLVLDPISAPKWRLQCNLCNCLVYLPEGVHRVSTTRDQCSVCASAIVQVDFNNKMTPLANGGTLHVACILCDELLHSLIVMKHGKSLRRGRKGFRRRGGRRCLDPKMSFRDF